MSHKIAVFASGNGSNFQAILDDEALKKLNIFPVLLVSDKPCSLAVKRAKASGVETFSFYYKEFKDKKTLEMRILEELQKHQTELVVLAGYMRLLTSVLINPYRGRIINIHPSLLPAFPGIDAIDKALEGKAKQTGVTVHFVDEGVDTGPIIAQKNVEIRNGESKEELEKRLHRVEHQLLPKAIEWFFSSVKEQKSDCQISFNKRFG